MKKPLSKMTPTLTKNPQKIHISDSDYLGSNILDRCKMLFHKSTHPIHIGLSGGNTPKQIFKSMRSKNFRESIDWNKVSFYLIDERYVDHQHPDSNYRMINECFLQHLPIQAHQTFPIPTHLAHPDDAAALYHKTLSTSLPSSNNLPQFDLLLLGIGADGHIASLFPDTSILSTKNKNAAAVYVPQLKSWRISLTFPIINNAKHLIFFAEGNQKAEIIQQALNTKNDKDTTLPIHQLKPRGTVEWFLDSNAASLLS